MVLACCHQSNQHPITLTPFRNDNPTFLPKFRSNFVHFAKIPEYFARKIIIYWHPALTHWEPLMYLLFKAHTRSSDRKQIFDQIASFRHVNQILPFLRYFDSFTQNQVNFAKIPRIFCTINNFTDTPSWKPLRALPLILQLSTYK